MTMAYISYVEDAQYQEALGSRQTANLLRTIFHSPIWAKAFVQLAIIQTTQLSLPAALRELVIMHTACLFQAEYVWAQHEGLSQMAGITKEQRDNLRRGNIDATVFSEKQKVLLHFITRLQQGEAFNENEIKTLSAYFSEQELIEIVGVHGFAYTVAKLTRTFDVEVDPIDPESITDFVNTVARQSN